MKSKPARLDGISRDFAGSHQGEMKIFQQTQVGRPGKVG